MSASHYLIEFGGYDLSDTTGVDPAIIPAGFAGYFVDHHELANTLTANSWNDLLRGHEENDVLEGEAGCDNLHGGTGNDLIDGGEGADVLYDRGADEPRDEEGGETQEQYQDLLWAYDPDGDDILNGGSGADILIYSGGTDVFDGGGGDDAYVVVPDAQTTNGPDDNLTIQFSGEFGHDLIVGTGAGVDTARFLGLNSSDVTINFEFTEEQIGEESAFVQTHFIHLLGVPGFDLGTYPIYRLTGSIEIVDNTNGSSVMVENVVGSYVGGDNNFNGNIYVQPRVFGTFNLEFDDGIIGEWGSLIEQNNLVSFVNTALSDTADDATSSFNAERAECAEKQGDREENNFNLIFGSDFDDLRVGTDSADWIRTFSGDDELQGRLGNDRLNGGAGADTLNGGDGFDIADYSTSSSGVVVSLRSGNTSGGDAEGDTLISIEDLMGSEFGDTLYGDNELESNVQIGLGGNDRLETGYGDFESFLYGGDGDDALIVRSGESYLDGGAGNDQLFGTTETDRMFGGEGDDTLTLDRGDDIYDGGDGYDILTSQFILSSLAARYIDLENGIARARCFEDIPIGIGSNLLVSIEGYLGGTGDDFVIGSDVGNLLSGGRGDDEIDGGLGNDTIYGGWNDDILRGGVGDDDLYGDIDPNLNNYTGSDLIFGGEGIDTAYYAGNFATYGFSTQDGVLFVNHGGGEVDQIASDVEFVTFADGTYTWSELSGISANNEPVAVEDTVSVTEGEISTIDLRLNDSDQDGDPLTVTQINGNDINPSSYIYFSQGFRFSMNSSGEIQIEADEEIPGLTPGATQDFVFNYTVSDGVGGFDTANIKVTATGRQDPPDGVLNGTEGNDTINGSYVDADGDIRNNLGQEINGLGGDDRIYDGSGDDTVTGGEGRDRFYAGDGADSYDGGSDNRDEVFYTRSSVGLTVDLSNTANNTGIAAGDSYTSIERLQGSNHDDILVSGGSIAILNGRAGDDDFTDDAGQDNFRGGAGADTFRFIAGDGKQDRIYDFEIGTDRIDLSAWGVVDFNDLSISEAINGSGNPLGRLVIESNSESLRLDGLSTNDIANLDASHFIFAQNTGDGIVSGTGGNDTINASYFDTDGDYVNNQGQTIRGLDGDDRIYDGTGDDIVEGGEGRDRFYAGDGADSYDGGADNRDEVFYHLSPTGLTVDASNNANSTGIAVGDTFTSVERLQGTNYDDILVSGGSVKVLNGRAGDDHFTDDAGNDFFRGGAGADTFQFIAGDNQQDRIYDFELNVDLIDLSAWGATSVADLTFSERLNGSGVHQGDLIIDYGSESLRLDGYVMADISSFDDSQFIFV